MKGALDCHEPLRYSLSKLPGHSIKWKHVNAQHVRGITFSLTPAKREGLSSSSFLRLGWTSNMNKIFPYCLRTVLSEKELHALLLVLRKWWKHQMSRIQGLSGAEMIILHDPLSSLFQGGEFFYSFTGRAIPQNLDRIEDTFPRFPSCEPRLRMNLQASLSKPERNTNPENKVLL
jgi:hypothetical protein